MNGERGAALRPAGRCFILLGKCVFLFDAVFRLRLGCIWDTKRRTTVLWASDFDTFPFFWFSSGSLQAGHVFFPNLICMDAPHFACVASVSKLAPYAPAEEKLMSQQCAEASPNRSKPALEELLACSGQRTPSLEISKCLHIPSCNWGIKTHQTRGPISS